MSKPSSVLDTCDISPVRSCHKQDVTPQRTRRKTSRRDKGIAVVASSSTPNGQKSSDFINISLNSPSSSFPSSQYSQEVAWEYTSPKLPRGSRAKEWKLSAAELLERLNQCKASGSNEYLQHRKLLENFISKLNDNTTVKKTEEKKKLSRKRPRNVLENLNKQMDRIIGLSKDNEPASKTRQGTSYNVEEPSNPNNTSKLNITTKSFIEGESDSTEELWGETDNSFMVRATQELESVLSSSNCHTTSSQEEMSTIPETAFPPKQEKQISIDVEQFLFQLSNVDWDDDGDNDDWDNGFIEDDALSMIPEEALSGIVVNEVVEQKVITEVSKTQQDSVTLSEYSQDTVVYNHKSKSSNQERMKNELFDSFEDKSYDEFFMNEPDVMLKIDELEYLSQQPKCTPEEINKKKEEAIKRRQRKTPTKK